jgi:hypothetical protein
MLDDKYSFTEVLPGFYEISVSQANLCWENHVQRVTIKEAIHSVPSFRHNGYQVSIITSHSTNIKYTLRSEADEKITKSLALSTGFNQFCVENSGLYDFVLSSCHIFDESQPSYFSTKDQSRPLTITAVKHKHSGVRILSEKSKMYKMVVEGDSGKQVNCNLSQIMFFFGF